MSTSPCRSSTRWCGVRVSGHLRAFTSAAWRAFVQPRVMSRLLGATVGGIGLLGVYAWLIEPRWLQVTHTRIRLPGCPPAFDGLRIALLSDLHLGHGTSRELIRRACRKALAADPDLIALTGDFIDGDAPAFRPALDELATLTAPLGVYAVPGNHDHRAGIGRWRREVARAPQIIDLTNQAIRREVHGRWLYIAGVDDFERGRPHLATLPPPMERDCTILLAHNPDQAEQLGQMRAGVDLVLSGHTHGGQVRLPGIGALRNPARHADIYEKGLHTRPWVQVYVSRGIGTVRLPIRLFCRPEVAILDLVAPR